MDRRTFLKAGLVSIAAASSTVPAAETPARPPNILWISAEDISPDLGCYGDAYASTPHLDAFAQTAIRYDRAYSHSGVCAPSRAGIITGMYPTAFGAHHMRCQSVPPPEVRCFPEYLRAAGYYCTNNRKTDYQFEPPLSAWDESSGQARWKGRAPEQPFFAVFNLTVCHESQVRSRDPRLLERIGALGDRRHDPDGAPVPPYHADTPATRADWAQYYDVVSLMDMEAGEILRELDEAGLAEDTIVWFWGDHGRGLTRCKRCLYESGTRIPLLIRVPEKYRAWVRPEAPESLAPGANADLVSFVDFAPTMLSLAGVPIPEHMQGQAFLGRAAAPPRDYVYGARDRMDEAYDIIRTVRDRQYRYFRNYMPYVTRAQQIDYMDEMPMAQELRRLHAAGELTADQAQWFAPRKPLEELYDVEADPHELNNLAGDPHHADTLARLRNAHEAWMASTGDLGLVPEPILDAWKWPGGGAVTCAAPLIREEGGRWVLTCPTPGASINYRWDDTPEKQWRLYTGSIPSRAGHALTAVANRIGFQDSPAVRSGETAANPAATGPNTFWGESGPRERLLSELRELRALDFRADTSTSAYFDALDHPEAAMRYWAIVCQHRIAAPETGADRIDAVRPLLGDKNAAVRVAAAHAMCDWGLAGEGLPVLEAVLSGGAQAERLYAIAAIRQLGEIARPLREAVTQAAEDPWRYVASVAGQAGAALDA